MTLTHAANPIQPRQALNFRASPDSIGVKSFPDSDESVFREMSTTRQQQDIGMT